MAYYTAYYNNKCRRLSIEIVTEIKIIMGIANTPNIELVLKTISKITDDYLPSPNLKLRWMRRIELIG